MIGSMRGKTVNFQVADREMVEEAQLSVASFLRSQRKKRGLTQQQLADRTNIGLSAIKQYERENGSDPTIRKAALLAKELDFDPKDLFAEIVDLPPMSEPAIDQVGISGARELREIMNLVNERSIHAQFLPRLVDQAITAMSRNSYPGLFELANEITFSSDKFPSPAELLKIEHDSGGNEETTKGIRLSFCETFEAHLVTYAVYGTAFFELALEQLRNLHRELASKTGESFPLQDVPTRSLLFDMFAQDEDDQKLQQQIMWHLPTHLVRAIRRGLVITLPESKVSTDNKT